MLTQIIAIFLGLAIAATLWEFIKLARWQFRIAFMAALFALLVYLQ